MNRHAGTASAPRARKPPRYMSDRYGVCLQRERVEWLQRIVDEESTKPLQVPSTYVEAATKQATDYSRRIANDNARRTHTLGKISVAAEEKATRRAREQEFHRRWNSSVGKDSSTNVDEPSDVGADLDEISQLAAQVRAQAERHAVDGSLPLDGDLGLDMMEELSLLSGGGDIGPSRSTVFRKVRATRLRNLCCTPSR
jgi:hypothetical protein